MNGITSLSPHGAWLAADPTTEATAGFAARMNGLLLSAAPSAGAAFAPGTVYRLTRTDAFAAHFGVEAASMVGALCAEGPNSDKRTAWNAAVRPVLVELSPVCDVAQNQRSTAMVIAGVIVPVANAKSIKSGDAFAKLPPLKLRWASPDFAEQDAVLVFCHRYKATFAATAQPDWIVPWFRLRDLPTASLRNAQSGHASRVGFVLLPG